MSNPFFDHPILNSPYAEPRQHWELDEAGQPTQQLRGSRRPARYVSPIPAPRRQRAAEQATLAGIDPSGLSTAEQQYDPTPWINELRLHIGGWRALPNSRDWRVSPLTARLLQHWRHHPFAGVRPFFCQVEAVEAAIWLAEVAPQIAAGRRILDHLRAVNQEANPALLRLALKLATGAGKTTVMAMLIAWQTLNAVRQPDSSLFTRGFLVVAPGLTIRDRLRVLQPADPDSYYQSRELVPPDLLRDLRRAKVVITNYHAFQHRERLGLAKGTKALLQGRTGQPPTTVETDEQMLYRVLPELYHLRRVLVLNDEAHHCYREKVGSPQERALEAEEQEEVAQNRAAARLWVSGLEALQRHHNRGLVGQHPPLTVIDLSATPFFLRGSGYVEGTLFPWTVSDFSLMDAIECGIVKLPRVPIADNIPGGDMPMYRDLWKHIQPQMPRKGRAKAASLDPLKLPPPLQTALAALYGHYERTAAAWLSAGLAVPPCFIIVCNNTASSKLVYDFVAGYHRSGETAYDSFQPAHCPLFSNFDDRGRPLPLPRTLLIDSHQLESGEGLDDQFRGAAAEEIEQFRRELVERTGNRQAGEQLTDQELLREVMNTVGKPGRLGAGVRCVVSVAMLTEGWDANTVTHVLGVRAFGTQLLCEQVVGRALRRQSYELGEDGLFGVEYADVLGVPFDFTARPQIVRPAAPREAVEVFAVRPERDALEIRFPRVEGYRVELPAERLTAQFCDDSRLILTPEDVGATETLNSGIIGEKVDLRLTREAQVRPAQVVFELTRHLLLTKWRDPGEEPKWHLFGQLKAIVEQWVTHYLDCRGGTYPAQLGYLTLADRACERITAAIVAAHAGPDVVRAVLDPYNPSGSTRHVRFTTTRALRWRTDPQKCHLNWAICDSEWEVELCRLVEAHPRVAAYARNLNLHFEVPYRSGFEQRRYWPDLLLRLLPRPGEADERYVVVETKGYRDEDAKDKKLTMESYWIPGVNHLGSFGHWHFAELRDLYGLAKDLEQVIQEVDHAI